MIHHIVEIILKSLKRFKMLKTYRNSWDIIQYSCVNLYMNWFEFICNYKKIMIKVYYDYC